MPFVLAPLFGFSAGALLSFVGAPRAHVGPGAVGSVLLGRRRTSPILATTERAPSGPGADAVSLFAALCWGPTATFFTAFEPDWAYLYAIDATAAPRMLLFLHYVVTAGSVMLGHAVASRFDVSVHPLRRVVLACTPGAIGASLFIAAIDRATTVTSYTAFQAGFRGETVWSGALGRALVWMGGLLTIGVLLTTGFLSRVGPDANER